MATPIQRQRRLQIIFLALIGITIPCYALGYTFVAVRRRFQPTPTALSAPTLTPSATFQVTSTAGAIVPTRFPTFTPSLTPTSTATRTDTPEPTSTFTSTPTSSSTPTATLTPSLTSSPVPDTIAPPETTEAPPPPTPTE